MKISFDELETAFLSSNEEIQNWVDRKTGNIIFIGSESVFGEIYSDDEAERQAINEILILNGELENEENIEIDKERYVLVSKPNSDDNFKVMEEWTLNFADEKIQPKLISALSRSKPFRNFKDVLLDFPNEREKWFAFENKNLREFIKTWAEANQIEIDYDKKNDS